MNFDTYERLERANYAALANAFKDILMQVIKTDPILKLHQIQARAKSPSSLKKKLEDRRKSDTTTLESDIKDLAGCRIIFYTNTDVTRFIHSGLVRENFEIVEAKIHYPVGEQDESQNLYISNHYLLKLKPPRLDLPEYAQFWGMCCEVQIQTILNHAWSEMEHDILYKQPALDGFGKNVMEAINRRLGRIMRKYLQPAGFEFQKITSDFERLISGKALFDENMLDSIITSENNNERVDAIVRFKEYVLPFYDDLPSVYDQILGQLIEAVKASRSTLPVEIETQLGPFPAQTVAEVIKCVTEILDTYRYVNVAGTFNALCELYAGAETESEQKPLLNLAKQLSRHNFLTWQTHGPIVQMTLVSRIKIMGIDELETLQPLLVIMLHEILKSEITGMSSSSGAFTLTQGAVAASDILLEIRSDGIDILRKMFAVAAKEADRIEILNALLAATIKPHRGGYSDDLVKIILQNSEALVGFCTEVFPTLTYPLRQNLQRRILHIYQIYRTIPGDLAKDKIIAGEQRKLVTAIELFRNGARTDRGFEIYNTLVGFEPVFEHTWDGDELGWIEREAYQNQQASKLLNEIDNTNSNEWFAFISNCATTQSNDLATFQVFAKFLTNFGETKPGILIGYFDGMDSNLARFLPPMLTGLLRSSLQENVSALIETWIEQGRYLPELAMFLRLAEPFNEKILQRVVVKAIALEDVNASHNALMAAAYQFEKFPETLVNRVFLPALTFLDSKNSVHWINPGWFSWRKNPLLLSLDAPRAQIVLDTMITYPEISHSAEEIVATLASNWPEEVIEFFGKRQQFDRLSDSPQQYSAIPYSIFGLRKPLAAAAPALIAAARRWYDEDTHLFEFLGGRLLAGVFPNFPAALQVPLTALVQSGDREVIPFVLAVLRAYRGEFELYGICREIVGLHGADDLFAEKITAVLDATGGVSGEFGYCEVYAKKITVIEPWLNDQNESVKLFAAKYIHKLQQMIAHEQRAAEESLALRKLSYGEELNSDP
jgi:ppGpp synthetase/RelA/SpoT-type nucleotidyltranferase